jgi:hypothetical protein
MEKQADIFKFYILQQNSFQANGLIWRNEKFPKMIDKVAIFNELCKPLFSNSTYHTKHVRFLKQCLITKEREAH